MEAGAGTPFLDFFKRGEVDRDIRMMAAECVLGLRPHEQTALLEFLVDDQDPDVAQAARASLRSLDGETPAPGVGGTATDAIPASAEGAGDEAGGSTLQRIAAMTPGQRLSLAMKGTREARAILIRDPNKIVSLAVLSSPKLTETEVEGIAKMANVSDEILRVIGQTRAWVKSYAIASALTRNPKTPLAVSMHLLARLHEKDVKMLAADRNVPDVLRLAARRKLTVK